MITVEVIVGSQKIKCWTIYYTDYTVSYQIAHVTDHYISVRLTFRPKSYISTELGNVPIMRTHIGVYQACPCAATREYSMLEHSCQSFVPDCFWFSDSADWMWPCDPWLPGRERWGHGCWGYGRGEPTPEDYPRSAWYASFMCVCLFVWLCVNRLAAGSWWLTWRDWRVEKEESERFAMMSWP